MYKEDIADQNIVLNKNNKNKSHLQGFKKTKTNYSPRLVSDAEIRRIKDAFKKSAGAGGTTISKNAFLQDVLSEGVPSVLADWLYVACGGQQRGISFKDLFCGLVLLTLGTQDEKIK